MFQRNSDKTPRYILTTNFPEINKNTKIYYYSEAGKLGWGFRKINMDKKPFNLKKNKINCIEEPKFLRQVCLYKL